MDLRSILNKPADKPPAGTTSRPPIRSASLAQPSLQHVAHQGHPSLARQQSFPAYTHPSSPEMYPNQPPLPHSSYAPHREEYFRDPSLSVSPKTMPNSIPRGTSITSQDPYHSHHPSLQNDQLRSDGHPLNTPSRTHTREHSIHSIISNPTSAIHEPISARDQFEHSPQFLHAASVTSSPVQARAHDFHSTYPSQSPVDIRSMATFQQPSQSPIQVKAMPPPIPPNPSFIQTSPLPPQSATFQTPTQPSPVTPEIPRSSHSMSAMRTPQDGNSESRKRSLSSTAEQVARPIKRRRYEGTPAWAQRARWAPLKTMDQWVVTPRESIDRPVESRPQRVPSQHHIERNGASPPAPAPAPATQTNGSNHAQSSRAFEVSPVGDYELSLDNHVPYNDITREIAEFLFSNVVQAPPMDPQFGVIEVEARLGKLKDGNLGDRVHLGITTEAALTANMGFRFESDMTIKQHRLLNEYLNTETERTRNDPKRVPIKYEHLREMDTFFEPPHEFLNSLPDSLQHIRSNQKHEPKVRATTNAQTGQFKDAIMKFRIADMEITCPKDAFDVRISVSVEIKFPHPVEGLKRVVERDGSSRSRYKDRLSYKHQFVSMDLTQVSSGALTGGRPDPQAEKMHELELELDTDLIVREGQKTAQGMPNNYEGIVGIFTNYIRVLNRASQGV
ncbi:mRNA triphosphatase CET1 [Microthyrium microscopicum]|uniref:mRNA-capping enzyme subunit beta n=1 Tax=Microthyrium microscopicum TaxID=703497 RepID=A0A6A6U7S8_9PEZI|nr:mRNA triphosphatase CET1 [Microthyrium microscopicum]